MTLPPPRSIPSVDKVLRDLGPLDLPRPAVVAVVRRELAALRAEYAGQAGPAEVTKPDTPDVPDAPDAAGAAGALARVRRALDALRAARLRPLINGTGIILHTNFGRAPLADEALAALADAAGQYTNLEYDLPGGRRGGRGAYGEHNLAVLCGAGAATVVNNCAAALVLILRHFVRPPRAQVVISRGELVQIGGGFRVPDILRASGAVLREVGTTNRTTADDYAAALGEQTALVLKVHRGNFYLGGFVESPATEAIAAAARGAGVPFAVDLGSGAVFPTEAIGRDVEDVAFEDAVPGRGAPGLGAAEGPDVDAGTGDAPAAPALLHEPTPAEVLRQGADLVCFSGDKLLGGPQAGIIAGPAALVSALKRDPFFRALRCDKLALAALQATVDLHLREQAAPSAGNAGTAGGGGNAGRAGAGGPPSAIPALAMMRRSNAELEARARRLASALAGLPLAATVGAGRAAVGGGSLPRTVIPSVTLDLVPGAVPLATFAARLRQGSPPVVGYVAGGVYKLDLRTIFPRQDEPLLAAIRAAAGVGMVG